jgi:GTP pyrophosphokinase
MEIYAPLAQRVGMYEYMREMQLLAFEQLEPEAYATIEGRLTAIRAEGGGEVDDIALSISQALAQAGLRVEVEGREKHPYSIWKKMAERHVSFEQITDIMAFRVLVDDIDECYKALGVLHQTWQMIPGRFKDYISTPKMNGYKSLHTSLIYNNARRVEVQIKTREMHHRNEYGLAAHWAYKQGGRPMAKWAGCAIWSRFSMPATMPRNCSKTPRWRSIRTASSRSPQGRAVPDAQGRHADRLCLCRPHQSGRAGGGAKINGRHVPLRTPLGNGDVVEIIKSRNSEPQLSWLGFAVTGKARAAIRRAVRQKERAEVALIGRKLYDEIIERLPTQVGKKALAEAIKRLKLTSEEDLMVAIGTAKLDDLQVMEALVPGCTATMPNPEEWRRQQRAIAVQGLTPGMAFKLAECCHPVPGDRIVGLRRPGQGSKSTPSTARRWPTASTPTGSTSRGTSAPTAPWAASAPNFTTAPARSPKWRASSPTTTPTWSTSK